MININFNTETIFFNGQEVGKFYLNDRGKFLVLSGIKINPDFRGSGYAQETMEQIIHHADEKGKILALTPSSDFGANKNKLINWYKSLGFVINKGKNKDYETMELMFREPKSDVNEMIRREIWTMNEMTENAGYLAFHGSPTKIEKFNTEFVGAEEATDQEGPGIYFTTSHDDAEGYANKNGFIYTVKLDTNKLLDESSSNNVNIESILWLIKQGHDWESHAQNWAENPEEGAIQAAESSIQYNEKEKDVFLQVWYDFYRHEPIGYVENMVKLGIDGIVIKKENNSSHIIIYNPNVISIREVEQSTNENVNEVQFQMQNYLDNAAEDGHIKDGGYAGNAIMPQSVSEGFYEDYSNISMDDLKKSTDFVENFNNTIKPDGKMISQIFKNYLICSQNIENSLKVSNNNINFFNKLMDIQKYLKNFGLLKEDLVYWGVDGSADSESDKYKLGAQGINEDGTSLYTNTQGTVNSEDSDWDLNEVTRDIINDLEKNGEDLAGFANKIAKKLGYSKASEVGEGGMGYAFYLDNDTILKITSDRSEAQEAVKLVGKNNKHLGNFYNVYDLGQQYKNTYIIIRENLEVNPDKYINLFNESLNEMKQYKNSVGGNKYFNSRDISYMRDINLKNIITKTENMINERGVENYPATLQFIGLVNDMYDNNIKSYDFTEYNFGFKKDGSLAYYDLGYSNSKDNPKMDRFKFESFNMSDMVMESINNVISERILSWMPKAKSVTVNKNCQLGGKGDGTSDACDQGDMNNLELKNIQDENTHKPNEPNVAEDNLKDRHYFQNVDRMIKEEIVGLSESIITRKEKDEIFNYRSLINDSWGDPIKQGKEFYKVNFDLENNESTKQKKTLFFKKNLRKDQPIKYEINAELWEAGGDWEYPVMYFKIEITSDYGLKGSKHKGKDEFPWDLENVAWNDKYVMIPPVEVGNKLTKYTDNAKNKYQWAAWQDESISDADINEKDVRITDSDRKSAWKWLEEKLENAVDDRHEMLDESVKKKNLLTEEKVKFGALMLYFDVDNWDSILSEIEEEDLYDDGTDTFGKEEEPHLTVLYGYHKEVKGSDFDDIVKDLTKFKVSGDKISLFENDEFDVVKIDINPTKKLKNLRKEVEKFPKTLTYKEFHPHMTIAYVKSGKGKKYVKDLKLKLESNKLVYSSKDRKRTTFNLKDTTNENSILELIKEGINNLKSNCKEIKVSDDIKNYVLKFTSDEELLRSGGIPINLLNKEVYGFTEDSLKTLMPNQLNIRWEDDIKNVKYEIKNKGISEKEYAESVDLTEPIDVSYWKDDRHKEGFYIEDGHHRYYAAKILNKPLNVNLEIKINPMIKLTDLGYDDFHRCLWKQVNNVTEEGKGTYIDSIINEGIITRDDLINFGKNKMIKEANIMSLQDLPFKQEIEKLGGKIYSVGGAVRDEFLGKESKDLDILITGIPFDNLEQLLVKYGKVDAVGKSFGVIKFIPRGSTYDIDIAIPRTETPTGEGGHKGFDVTSNHNLPIEDDLKRRDFTINAIAKDINGNLIDPYGGQKDLASKIIRVVNPEAFSDDPLRMLRAVQFASRFDFTIEPKTMELIKQNASKINEIAGERMFIELEKIVTKGNKRVGAQLLKNTGLFKNMFGIDLDQLIIDESPFDSVKTMGEFIVLLTKQLDNSAEVFRTKLKGDIPTFKEIEALSIGFNSVSDNHIKNRVVGHNMFTKSPNSLNSKILPENLKKAIGDLNSGQYPKSIKELNINGNDLMGMGLKGKEVGDGLKRLLINVYGDKLKNNREDLTNFMLNANQ